MRPIGASWLLAVGVVLAAPVAAFTPTQQEACCQSLLQGRDDPVNCGTPRPTVQACTEVVAAMGRAAAAQARARASTDDRAHAGAGVASPAPSRLPTAIARWAMWAVASVLALLVLRRLGARPLARASAVLAVFVGSTAASAWGLTTAACAALRCVDTMGLGILVAALLPSTALSAWLARRLWRRFPGGNATGSAP